MNTDKKSPREIYRASAERVSLALELFGPQSQTEEPNVPRPTDLTSVSQMMSQLVASHTHEPDNNYRTTILQIGRWLSDATKAEFLEANRNANPHPYYVVRKGLEVLHMLMHRDLRRKVLSSTESQVYYDFVRITAKLSNPTQTSISPGSQTGTA